MESKGLYCLIQIIQLIALGCDEQIRSMPTFVHVPDEIAQLLDDSIAVLEGSNESGQINPAVFTRIKHLDDYFDGLGKDQFTLDSLCTSEHWDHARKLAKEILKLMQLEEEKPDLGWIRFVQGP